MFSIVGSMCIENNFIINHETNALRNNIEYKYSKMFEGALSTQSSVIFLY